MEEDQRRRGCDWSERSRSSRRTGGGRQAALLGMAQRLLALLAAPPCPWRSTPYEPLRPSEEGDLAGRLFGNRGDAYAEQTDRRATQLRAFEAAFRRGQNRAGVGGRNRDGRLT